MKQVLTNRWQSENSNIGAGFHVFYTGLLIEKLLSISCKVLIVL